MRFRRIILSAAATASVTLAAGYPRAVDAGDRLPLFGAPDLDVANCRISAQALTPEADKPITVELSAQSLDAAEHTAPVSIKLFSEGRADAMSRVGTLPSQFYEKELDILCGPDLEKIKIVSDRGMPAGRSFTISLFDPRPGAGGSVSSRPYAVASKHTGQRGSVWGAEVEQARLRSM